MERCFLGEQIDAVERGLSLPYLALFGHVTGNAIACDRHLRVQRSAESLALVAIGEAVEQRVLYLVETLDRLRRIIDRIDALPAIAGVGRGEERILLGGDEAVQLAFDTGVVGDLFRARD